MDLAVIIVMAVTILILLILSYFLFTNQKKEEPPRITRTNAVKSTIPSTANTTQNSTKNQTISRSKEEVPRTPIIARTDNPVLSDVFGSLKKNMQAGVEAIFTAVPDLNDGNYPVFDKDKIDPDVMELITAHIKNMKNFRSEHFKLQKVINDPAVQMTDLSKIIMADPMLTAKILSMANSPYFGMQGKIDSISHALMIMGLQNIKNILYREGMLQMFQSGSAKQKEEVAKLWKHSSLVSVATSYLHDMYGGLNKGTLFTLGIIHDIGKLIILGMPKAQEQQANFLDTFSRTAIYEEDVLHGINHAVIGSIALEQWGFSELMISTVEMHHAPSFIDADSINLDEEHMKYIMVLFAADQIAKLFADREKGTIEVYSLLESYYPLLDKNRLSGKVADTAFLAQMREAEMIAMSEYGIKPSDKNETQTIPDTKQKPIIQSTTTRDIDEQQPFCRLKLIHSSGRELVINDGDLLGKNEGSHKTFLSGFKYISGSHALLSYKNNQWYIKDLNSTNKTKINGQIIVADLDQPVNTGDKIILANQEFSIQ